MANRRAQGNATHQDGTTLLAGEATDSPIEIAYRFAAALVARIHSGESTAEHELVLRYRSGLIALLRRWTGDRVLAEDLAHETLLATIERLRTRPLDEPTKLSAFMRGTANNLALAHKRKEARRRTKLAGDGIYLHADGLGDPAILTELSQEIGLARRLINELKVVRDRELLYRYYVAGESKAQICATFNLDVVHFNRVLHRARGRLRELLSTREAGPSSDSHR